jgi:hypothetical protein
MAESLLYILFKTKFRALNTLLNYALFTKIKKLQFSFLSAKSCLGLAPVLRITAGSEKMETRRSSQTIEIHT